MLIKSTVLHHEECYRTVGETKRSKVCVWLLLVAVWYLDCIKLLFEYEKVPSHKYDPFLYPHTKDYSTVHSKSYGLGNGDTWNDGSFVTNWIHCTVVVKGFSMQYHDSITSCLCVSIQHISFGNSEPACIAPKKLLLRLVN